MKYTIENRTEATEGFDIYEENKSSLIEYFSQTGSYYKINEKYSWTQGVYGVANYEDIIRIKTHDGIIKYLDMNFYSKFDKKGELLSRYVLIKDITKNSDKK